MIDNTTQDFKLGAFASVSVGYWDTNGGITFWMTKRPNWFHQKMIYLFFGWKWTDKEKNT
jgi:hypothetical protein